LVILHNVVEDPNVKNVPHHKEREREGERLTNEGETGHGSVKSRWGLRSSEEQVGVEKQ
jgi:hypothetical protein